MNRYKETSKITAALLAAVAPRVRIILWDKAHGIQSIESIAEFCNDDTDYYYNPMKIAKGKKLAAYARYHVACMVEMLNKYPDGFITVEEVTP